MLGAPIQTLPAHALAVGLMLILAGVVPGKNTDHDALQSPEADARPVRQNPQARAAAVRAMIILKIAPHLRFPDAKKSTEPFRIGLVGEDLLANAIQKHLPGKLVGKRKVVVEVIAPDVAKKAEKRTHDVLYVAKTLTAPKVEKLVKTHERLATVLICERPGFAHGNGDIQLFVAKKKIRFEINQRALKKKKVRANPNLLKLSNKGPRK